MFEGITEEVLLDDVLSKTTGIDTRPGSIFYDAVSAILIKVAKFYTDLDLILELTSIDTAKGEALDTKASEYGMKRNPATAAKYYITFEGVKPSIGERFYTDGNYFILRQDDQGIDYLEAEQMGEKGNHIYSGTAAIPVNNMNDLLAATFGEIYENGADQEEDEKLRTRVKEKIAGPAENGNKQHYKTWCESIEGVGRARVFPLWNGPNTIKAILIDSVGQPCGASKVAEVQNYIDPAEKGYTTIVDGREYVVGDGLGEGVANLGAHFTAATAIPLTINISFKAELRNGITKDIVQHEVQEAMEEYLRDLVLNTLEATDIVVRLTAIGAILNGLKNLLDYSELTINGEQHNIIPKEDYVPVLGEVEVY